MCVRCSTSRIGEAVSVYASFLRSSPKGVTSPLQAEARGYQQFAASCEHQPETMNLRALIEKTPDAKLLPR